MLGKPFRYLERDHSIRKKFSRASWKNVFLVKKVNFFKLSPNCPTHFFRLYVSKSVFLREVLNFNGFHSKIYGRHTNKWAYQKMRLVRSFVTVVKSCPYDSSNKIYLRKVHSRPFFALVRPPWRICRRHKWSESQFFVPNFFFKMAWKIFERCNCLHFFTQTSVQHHIQRSRKNYNDTTFFKKYIPKKNTPPPRK